MVQSLLSINDNNIGTIRINPNDEQYDENTIHINMTAKNGIKALF